METVSAPNRPLSVLIIDPSSRAAAALSALLDREGCVTRWTEDADVACSVVAEVLPDVILIRAGAREFDCCAVAHQLRQLSVKKPPLLAALAAAGEDGSQRKLFQAGFDLRLGGPPNLADIRSHLAAKRRATPSPS